MLASAKNNNLGGVYAGLVNWIYFFFSLQTNTC
jgi:hypothetical protein